MDSERGGVAFVFGTSGHGDLVELRLFLHTLGAMFEVRGHGSRLRGVVFMAPHGGRHTGWTDDAQVVLLECASRVGVRRTLCDISSMARTRTHEKM